MRRTTRHALVGLAAIALVATALALPAGADDPAVYEVTITDLTSGQPLTPPVVATHRGGVSIFRVGRAASFEVKEIAENGNNAPLLTALGANARVFESLQAGSGPLVPAGTPGSAMFGDSVTFTITADGSARYLSWMAMLICTNDGFTGSSRVPLPRQLGGSLVMQTAGYDSGTEINTEDFADMVPPCQGLIGVSSGEAGTGTSDPALAEGGTIAHHAGIQGGSDLLPEVHGWTDPVAQITITRVG
jgi:hypothetical protein